jgi:hypothetical protein
MVLRMLRPCALNPEVATVYSGAPLEKDAPPLVSLWQPLALRREQPNREDKAALAESSDFPAKAQGTKTVKALVGVSPLKAAVQKPRTERVSGVREEPIGLPQSRERHGPWR